MDSTSKVLFLPECAALAALTLCNLFHHLQLIFTPMFLFSFHPRRNLVEKAIYSGSGRALTLPEVERTNMGQAVCGLLGDRERLLTHIGSPTIYRAE